MLPAITLSSFCSGSDSECNLLLCNDMQSVDSANHSIEILSQHIKTVMFEAGVRV